MTELVPSFVIFAISLAGLMKSSDVMVEGASCLAKKLNVSDLVIGLTVVALGTSLPELVVSVGSSYKGLGNLAASNVIGSNVANIILVLGAACLITPISTPQNLRRVDKILFLSVFVVFFMSIVLFADGQHPKYLGIVYLGLFFAFIYSMFKTPSTDHIEFDTDDSHSLEKATFLTLAGLVFLIICGHYTVDSATTIARLLSVPEETIGVTIVAIGTSLPELVASVVASLKGKADMAVGNIIGSNFMNLSLVLGTSQAIQAIDYSAQMINDGVIMVGINILFMATASLKSTPQFGRFMGVLYMLGYIFFIAKYI